jgi:hypothetical protein
MIESIDAEGGSSNHRTGYVRLQLELESDGQVKETAVLETNLTAEYEKVAWMPFAVCALILQEGTEGPVRAQFQVTPTFKVPPTANSR